MTQDVDDIHAYDSGFLQAMARLETLDTSDQNKNLIKQFVRGCRRENLAKSTTTNYINLLKRMIQRLQDIGYMDDLDNLDQDSFDDMMFFLEDTRGISQGERRNYKKVTKKFFRTLCDDEDDIPKWVRKLKLGTVTSPIQPGDLPDKHEIEKLLSACSNARDRAFIAVSVDGGMRVGALASCRIKNVESGQYGVTLYISKTSRSRKTTPAKGIPLTWSSGYLQQWLAVHPMREDPEAPLWITLDKNHEPLSYKTIRVTIQRIAKKAGVERRIHPHLFRHVAITDWILDGLNEQEIKHRAGWSRGSIQLFKIYANFTDQEMNDKIYEKYGLKKDNVRDITLKNCPRCNNILRPTDKFCSQCSLVLDRRALDEIQEIKNTLPEIMQMVMKSEAARQILERMEAE